MGKNEDFMKGTFRDFYESHEVAMPLRFSRREFGFMQWGSTFFNRHIQFQAGVGLEMFLKTNAPPHCYFSSAYYEHPAAPHMKDKLWKGADLIFDLDADHLEGAKEMTLKQQLDEVKVDVLRLVDQFLVVDFGMKKDEMMFAFSGGRGYHIHVREDKFQGLDTHCRREIAGYITGRDVNVTDFIHEKVVDAKKDKRKDITVVSIPPINATGWKAKYTRALVQEIELLRTLEHRTAKKRLMKHEGIAEKTAEAIIEALVEGKWAERNRERLSKGQVEGIFDSRKTLNALLIGAGSTLLGHSASHIDAPVTGDTKRLIRLPGTLHGKTGLRSTILTYEELLRFKPLEDAVALPDTPIVRVKATKEGRFTLKQQEFRFLEGEEAVLPCFAAVFAVGRGMAEVV